MEHCVDFAFKGGASGEAKPIFRPSPGRLRRVDIRRVKPVGDFTFTTGVLQPLAIQAILNTAALTSASTQFNPQEGIVPLKGWLKMQAYDDEDVAIWTADKFGELSVPGDTKLDPENPTNVAWDFMGLHSLLDTGTLHV